MSKKLILEEDASTSTEVMPGPKTPVDTGISNVLIDAINGEWNTIKLYNSIINQLRGEKREDIIPIIEDINQEENMHVGQLQEALKLYSPNTKTINTGSDEAAEQLGTDDSKDTEEASKETEGLSEGFVEDAEDTNFPARLLSLGFTLVGDGEYTWNSIDNCPGCSKNVTINIIYSDDAIRVLDSSRVAGMRITAKDIENKSSEETGDIFNRIITKIVESQNKVKNN